MPNSTEWSNDWYKWGIDFRGGSSIARGYDGESVIIGRYGEFSARFLDGGELVAGYPEKGLTCGYDKKGRLDFVSLEMTSYLGGIWDDGLEKMARDGDEIGMFLDLFEENNEFAFFVIDLREGVFGFDIRDDEGDIIKQTRINAESLVPGVCGQADFYGSKIAYQISVSGDELIMGLGENEGEKWTTLQISIAKRLDYDRLFECPSESEMYQKMADEMVLNR